MTASLVLLLGVAPHVAHAEASAPQSNANTPKHALHKAELWLAMAEPKPSVADLDAGLGAASAVEERMTMLNTEIGAVASRRRTVQLQAVALRQKAAGLRAERDAAKGENGIKRSDANAKIVELEQRAATLDAQAETFYGYMQRMGDEEKGLVDSVGRMRSVADMIETSSIADAKQKQKATALASKTTRSIRIHAAIIMTMMGATSGQSFTE